MGQIRLLQVALARRVLSRRFLSDQALRLSSGHAEINHQVLARQAVDFVFELLQPMKERSALSHRHAGALVREIRADIAVGEEDLAGGECRFHFGLGFEAIASIEQRGKVGIDRRKGPKLAVQELRDHSAEETFVAGKTDARTGNSACFQGAREHFDLGALTGTVDSFEHDQFSARRHGEPHSLARLSAC